MAKDEAVIDNKDLPSYSVWKSPTYVGHWLISQDKKAKYIGFAVTTTKKPNWFHKLMAKLLLNWEYQES